MDLFCVFLRHMHFSDNYICIILFSILLNMYTCDKCVCCLTVFLFNKSSPVQSMWSRYLFGGVSVPFISHVYLSNPWQAKCEIIDAPPTKSSYDYIVIGSGSGGSAVAGQLALLSDSSVLLIEEGMDVSQSPLVNDASHCLDVLSNPDFKRAYHTTPQPGLNNRFQPQWKAIMTGGCASHNTMFWAIGSRRDFNQRWNINGWRWRDLSPYWDKINKIDFDISTYHDDGYKDVFLQAAKECGYRYNSDYNELNSPSENHGVSYTQQNVKPISPYLCQRQTSWSQYVQPVLRTKSNLDVMVNTKATKVLIDESANKPIANGVRIKRKDDDKYLDIKCNKEVILSAGTFDTVKLLMLSGIGDRKELEKEHGIRCVSNAPAVGKNLEDHPVSYLISPKLKGVKASECAKKQRSTFEGIFIVSDDDEYEHMIEIITNECTGLWCFGAFDDPEEVHILVFSQVEHYTSRGVVTIDKENPEENKPVINPCYLSNKVDERKAVESFKKARQLCYTEAFNALYDGDERDEVWPGYHVKTEDDEGILRWIKKEGLMATAHPCGTCKMGDECTGDNVDTIVVDNRLRVRGVDALRIADSSIMPSLITGHTNAITILIGVKAADLILEDNGERPCIDNTN
eukprot:954207_1